MQILAWIFFVLVNIYNLLLLISPLAMVRNRENPQLGWPVLWSFLRKISIGLMFSIFLALVGGKDLLELDWTTLSVLAIISWITLFGGLGIVIWSFIKASRLRKQEQAHRLG